jgi:hypothetical protein
MWANTADSFWAACWATTAPVVAALAAPWVELFWSVLAVCAVIGTSACRSRLEGARVELELAPALAIARPPGRMLPEKAARRDSCRVWYLEMFTEEIEKSTMNSAISSVIMSA